MTARTPPAVSDAAVEAYLIGASLPDGGRPDMTGHEYVEYIQRTYSTGDLIRAGLAAALPHLRSAAPSGETAPHPDHCGDVLTGAVGHLVAVCIRPAGHGGGHLDESGVQWGSLTAPAPAGVGVAAASVPARTNAQATPASLPLSEIQAELDGYASARDRLGRADEDHPGAMDTAEIRAMDAAGSLAEAVLRAARRAAAPSGEQPTPPDDQVDAIRREVYDNVYVNDDGYPWLTCGLCGKRLVELEAGIEWPDLDRKVTGHDCAKPADQSGTEPVGEVPDHG